MKCQLWTTRLSTIFNKVTRPWNNVNLETVLKSLKNNKSIDPNGMVNELFKTGCIGSNLKEAILNLVNGIKAHQFVPTYMTLANITTIYKNKGSRKDLENDRGILY